MVALEDTTAHYPETLRRWRENLDANAAELAARGYDDRFQRLWRLYLCWWEVGFAMRRISDVQIVLGKPAWRGTVSVSDSRAGTALHGEAAG